MKIFIYHHTVETRHVTVLVQTVNAFTYTIMFIYINFFFYEENIGFIDVVFDLKITRKKTFKLFCPIFLTNIFYKYQNNCTK